MVVIATSAQAQASAVGHAILSILVGESRAPFCHLAQDVVDQALGNASDCSHAGFRIVGGYQFAEHFSMQAGVMHAGSYVRSVPYQGSDMLTASADLNVVEADLVAHVPFLPFARLDLAAGLDESAFNTALSTAGGSALPAGQRNPVNVRRLGATLAADLEFRISEHTSLFAGYHAYVRAGSSRVIGSAAGTASLLGAGVSFQF
ncbi:MAG: outer membrane beta-barrel protein [Proteobacteria bacterium]|nr:outer membrane beta-barrel protein [Pseudomonadota bacterium]